MATSTVENYLKAILLRSDRGNGILSMGALAGAMDVTPGTVTTMAKAIVGQGFLEHLPRRGVRLTPAGRAVALGVLRKHRLVETFLVQVLQMDWTEVHEEAEALEHAISDRVLARIDALLGHPAADPHGDPIPSRKGRLAGSGEPASPTLATCKSGRPLHVMRIIDQTPEFLEFIQRAGLKPGARLRVLRRDPAGGVVECRFPNGREAILGLPEAGKIEVGGR